jgi:hypothetical protein
MRKLTVILMSLLLVVGLGSCKKDNGVKGPNNNGNNGNGTATTEQNELPLLKFDFKTKSSGEVISKDIIDHEAKIGREATKLTVGTDDKGNPVEAPAFVNTDLTIAGVVYMPKLKEQRSVNIYAFANEKLGSCPKTIAMLKEVGFDKIEDKQFSDKTPYKYGVSSKDDKISVLIMEETNEELGTSISIRFEYKPDLEVKHPFVSTAKDFPDYETFMTKDVDKIKAFEEKLGFREPYKSGDAAKDAAREQRKELWYITKEAQLPNTNFLAVVYISTPTKGKPFIKTILCSIKNEKELADPKVKEWFTANGYGEKFEVSTLNGYAAGFDKTGKTIAFLYIDKENGTVFLEIGAAPEKNSVASQLRLLNDRKELSLSASDFSAKKQLQ